MRRELRAVTTALVTCCRACGPTRTTTEGDAVTAIDVVAETANDVAAIDATIDAADAPDDVVVASAWLEVRGNRITHADGSPFRGRGANLHDERSCDACSFGPRDPAGVSRWADELMDHWHASLVRFPLSAKAAPYNEWEQQWRTLSDDPDYLADVVANVTHMTDKGAYVLVTSFADPTTAAITASSWCRPPRAGHATSATSSSTRSRATTSPTRSTHTIPRATSSGS